MDGIALEWEAIGKTGRDIKRGHAHERDANPFCDLSQRGAYRIRDTKATPPDLSPREPSVERVGTWAYRVKTS